MFTLGITLTLTIYFFLYLMVIAKAFNEFSLLNKFIILCYGITIFIIFAILPIFTRATKYISTNRFLEYIVDMDGISFLIRFVVSLLIIHSPIFIISILTVFLSIYFYKKN